MSDGLSNIEINGERQTWKQLYEREVANRERLEAFRRLVTDLSRCPHGRHLGDVCSGCGGPSNGNPHAVPGSVIGYDIDGHPYVVPAKAQFASIEEWRALAAPTTEAEMSECADCGQNADFPTHGECPMGHPRGQCPEGLFNYHDFVPAPETVTE